MGNITDDTLISVRNRCRGNTGYTLENIHRNFAYGETKKVPFKELRELTYIPGGQFALDNYLVVENQEALDLLNMTVEPEYFYSEDEIRDLLLYREIPAFEDFLDFAPKGAIDMAVNIAVSEELPDVRKRDLLGKKAGINITNAITVNKVMNEDEAEVEAPKQRRVEVKKEGSAPAAPARKAGLPKYNVVKK